MATPTLAELRAQTAPVVRPKAEATVTLVEGQHLLTRAQQISRELDDLRESAATTDEEGNPTGPPQKAGQGAQAARERNDRIKELGEETTKITSQLGDFQAVVGLEGLEGGEWQRFKDANPPREDSVVDMRLTRGHCNATALFEDLGSYVKTWNGEPVAEGDWDTWLAERITYSDRRDLVTAVVLMHEQGLNRVPKSSTGSSETETSETA